jgi:hypothetical protein
MDAAYLRRILEEETEYLTRVEKCPRRVICVDLSNADAEVNHQGAFKTYQGSPTTAQESSGNIKVLFIQQGRLYYRGATINKIFLDHDTWKQVLEKHSVLPAAIELLNDNNGGNAKYISYATEGKLGFRQKVSNQNKDEVSAFHVCVKIGDFGNREHFVYARHDFHSQETIILVAGAFAQDHAASLEDKIMGGTIFNPFCLLLDISSFWFHRMEL